MQIMSRANMLAQRRAAALAPLDTINEGNAAEVLRDTSRRLLKLFQDDVQHPKFGADLRAEDVNEFKSIVSELWTGLASVSDADVQEVEEADGQQLLQFVRHLARLTDDLSASGTFSRCMLLVDVVIQ